MWSHSTSEPHSHLSFFLSVEPFPLSHRSGLPPKTSFPVLCPPLKISESWCLLPQANKQPQISAFHSMASLTSEDSINTDQFDQTLEASEKSAFRWSKWVVEGKGMPGRWSCQRYRKNKETELLFIRDCNRPSSLAQTQPHQPHSTEWEPGIFHTKARPAIRN